MYKGGRFSPQPTFSSQTHSLGGGYAEACSHLKNGVDSLLLLGDKPFFLFANSLTHAKRISTTALKRGQVSR